MQDEFDAMIDTAVTSYAAAEPSPDLAAGILRRAQKEPLPQRKVWKLALAFALPLAAAAALAVVLVGRLSLPQAPVMVAAVPATPNVQAVSAMNAVAPAPVHPHARRIEVARTSARSWARPLPPPYTKQELALLAFVEQHPKEAAEVAQEQARPLKPLPEQPITISHLEIAPLTIASLDQEK